MGDPRSFDKSGLDHGCSGSGGDPCSSLACVFAVAVSIVAVMAALVITGFVLAGIGVGYLFTKGVAVGLGLLGGGLLVLALGVLAVWLVVWCFGWFVPWAVKGIAGLCKKAFSKTKRGV